MTVTINPPRKRGGMSVDWEAAYSRYGETLKQAEAIIASAEEDRALSLTPTAVLLLLTPILDELDAGRTPDENTLKASIAEIFDELAVSQDHRDHGAQRSSVSIILAWHLRWCKIPPFCAKP